MFTHFLNHYFIPCILWTVELLQKLSLKINPKWISQLNWWNEYYCFVLGSAEHSTIQGQGRSLFSIHLVHQNPLKSIFTTKSRHPCSNNQIWKPCFKDSEIPFNSFPYQFSWNSTTRKLNLIKGHSSTKRTKIKRQTLLQSIDMCRSLYIAIYLGSDLTQMLQPTTVTYILV